MGKLTRTEMERVIQEGGSVCHQGVILSAVEHLPSEADLARGDETAEAKVAADLEARIAALEAERDSLLTGKDDKEAGKPGKEADKDAGKPGKEDKEAKG